MNHGPNLVVVREECPPVDVLLGQVFDLMHSEVMRLGHGVGKTRTQMRALGIDIDAPPAEEPTPFWVYYRSNVDGEIKRLRVRQPWLTTFAAVRAEYANLDIVAVYHGEDFS